MAIGFSTTEKAATAALTRGLAAGEIDAYFGSTLALTSWLAMARRAGLVEPDVESLTAFGETLAAACTHISEGRWYFHEEAYATAFDQAYAQHRERGGGS